MNIGLIGVGTIGTFLLEKLNNEKVIPGVQIIAILDERKKSAQKLKSLAKTYHLTVCSGLDIFLKTPTDLIIECANIEAVQKYAKKILHHKDLFLISVGALADPLFTQDLREISKQKKRKLYLPSGAIGGLDVLRAANVLGGLDSVQLITRKPAHALSHNKLEGQRTVFEGSAQEAIHQYPKNANIAIMISLSGIGVEQTKVKIIADPNIQKNIHHLKASGDFGKLSLELENNPSPSNPKTSFLTALSILSSLKALDHSIVIG